MSIALLESGSHALLEDGASVLLLEDASAAVQTFRQALYAKLAATAEVTALVGSAIYPGAVPETHDYGRDGPALTYTVITYPPGHVLTGSDGTATARVQLSAWSYQESQADAITLAVCNALDGVPVNPWGTGYIVIMSVVHKDEQDLPAEPRSGSDQWLYQVPSDYSIKHRCAIPSLT